MAAEYFFNFDKLSYITGEKPDGCILCLIRDGDSRVVDLTVYRDGLFVVSVNLYPFNPGHLMIFPIRHVEDVRGFTTQEDTHFSRLNRFFLDLLDGVYHPMGYNLGYNMGLVAGASILHLHAHIIPRYSREIGLADLIAGKRVLVEDPRETQKRVIQAVSESSPPKVR
jgi:ATP adenylyltransferase